MRAKAADNPANFAISSGFRTATLGAVETTKAADVERELQHPDDHAHRVFRIETLLREASAAPSFEDAGRPLSYALGIVEDGVLLNGRKPRPLSDDDAERLIDCVEYVLGASGGWERHAYAGIVGEGLEAFADQFRRWNGQTVETPLIDTNQRARILRNAAHNAAMTKEINARVHARRERRVVSLAEYRDRRRET